jgi:hypothetical protein
LLFLDVPVRAAYYSTFILRGVPVRAAFGSVALVVASLATLPALADSPDWLLVRTPASPPPRDAHATAFDTARNRLVLFGGANEAGVVDFADTWEWNGTSWIERAPAASPTPRYGHAMAYDAARGRVVLFGGYDFLQGLLLSDTWEWDGTNWIEAAPATTPPGRFGHGMVYDSARQRIVMFGGVGDGVELGDTWEWDGTNWIEATPATAPPAREYGALAYDGARGRTVLFGGYDGTTYFADTWEWDGNDWVERTPAMQPPGRTWHMLTFDAARGRTVLFGGYDGNIPYADTWEWDGNAWLDRTPATTPSPRVVGALTFDVARGQSVLFGGYDGQDSLADTWAWDGTSWTEKSPQTSPPQRSNHAIAYDDARGKTVVFGGYGGGPFLADTWEWDGASWVDKTPAVSPPSRIFAAMAYDRARGKVVLFGGYGQHGPVADTWEWDGTSWTQKNPATSPAARHSHTMAYDAARGRVVLFGGSNSFDIYADTWEWDGTDWVEVSPAIGPSPRYRHAMAYDAARQRIVLFGGADEMNLFGDTWEWDGASWADKTPAAGPPARWEHAMAYDAARQRAVIFGGSTGAEIGSDTWEWDGSAWTEATPASRPAPRFHHAMTYDAVSGRVLLFGGYNGTYLADTWRYGPLVTCGNANRVVSFAPGAGASGTTADSALGPPDGVTVALGIGGSVDLGLDQAVPNRAGADLLVRETAGGSFRAEVSVDGDDFFVVRDCPGGECQLDLSEAGLASASFVRITSLAPDVSAEIDAVMAVHGPPPTISCPASVVVECQSAGHALITVPPATAGDSCSGAATIANDYNAGGADASGPYPLGTTTVTFTASDGAGGLVSCSTPITVEDTTPPVVIVRAAPDMLWPPDHTMRPVHFTVAAVDACDPSPVVLLQSVTSSEPDDAPTIWDGATTGDIAGVTEGAPDFDVLLRAERNERGGGRTYRARYVATDASGNAGTGVGAVTAPREFRRPPPPLVRTVRPHS